MNFSFCIRKLAVAFYIINEIQPKIKFQNIVQCPSNPNSIIHHQTSQKLSPKHAARGVAQSPHPIYRHGKACLSKQPPWRAAGDPRLARGRSRVRAPGPAGALRALFFSTLPSFLLFSHLPHQTHESVRVKNCINLERWTQHTVNTHANTSNGIKILTFLGKVAGWCWYLSSAPFSLCYHFLEMQITHLQNKCSLKCQLMTYCYNKVKVCESLENVSIQRLMTIISSKRHMSSIDMFQWIEAKSNLVPGQLPNI